MAIKYYCGLDMLASIDLNQNQLVNARIENLATSSEPAANDSVSGQIYYNTSNNVLKFFNGTAWVTLAASGGGVTSLSIGNASVNSGGVNTSLTVSASTGAVTLTPKIYGGGANIGMVPTGGSAGKYLDGTGAWVDVSTGDLTGLTAGDGISITNASGPVPTVAVKYAGATDNLIQSADSLEGTGIATNDIIIYSDHTDSDKVVRGLVSDLPFAPSGTVSGVTSIATTSPIEGGTITGTGTISHAAQAQTNTTPATTLTYGGTFTALSANVGVNSTGHVTGQTLTTFTMPASDDTTYDLLTTNGSNPDLLLDPSTGSNDIVNMNGTSTTVSVTGSNTNTLTFDLVDSPTIADSLTVTNDLTVGDDIALTGGSSKITGLVTAQIVNDTDAANKKYVDDLVAGGLTFKDGFNAGTGAIDGGGNLTTGASRVAVSVGDYYVVTTAGSFYGSVSLDVGDSVIAKLDAAQGTSDINDWVIVQGDEGVVSIALATAASSGSPLTANATSGAITLTSRSYAGSSNVGYVPTGGTATTFLRGDGTWVTPTDTQPITYDLEGVGSSNGTAGVRLSGNSQNDDVLIVGSGTSTVTRSGNTLTVTSNDQYDGTVTSVGCTINGDAYSASVANSTTAAAITIAPQGTSSQYIDGAGDLQTFPTIPQGDVTAVQASTTNSYLGINVTDSTGPIPKVGLSIGSLADIGASTNLDDSDAFPFYDENVTTNKRVSLRELADYIVSSQSYATTLTSPSAGSEPVTHNLGSYDVIVQLYGDTSKETIYACVDRTSTNALSITFDSAVGQDVRVLVSRVTNE